MAQTQESFGKTLGQVLEVQDSFGKTSCKLAETVASNEKLVTSCLNNHKSRLDGHDTHMNGKRLLALEAAAMGTEELEQCTKKAKADVGLKQNSKVDTATTTTELPPISKACTKWKTTSKDRRSFAKFISGSEGMNASFYSGIWKPHDKELCGGVVSAIKAQPLYASSNGEHLYRAMDYGKKDPALLAHLKGAIQA